jgi:hypothetical protein
VTALLPERSACGDPQFEGVPHGSVVIGNYQPMIPRLTAADVVAATPPSLEIEQGARARLGDRVMSRAGATFRRADEPQEPHDVSG